MVDRKREEMSRKDWKTCAKCGGLGSPVGLPGEQVDGDGNFICWSCHVDRKYPNAQMPAGWMEPGYLEKAAGMEK